MYSKHVFEYFIKINIRVRIRIVFKKSIYKYTQILKFFINFLIGQAVNIQFFYDCITQYYTIKPIL